MIKLNIQLFGGNDTYYKDYQKENSLNVGDSFSISMGDKVYDNVPVYLLGSLGGSNPGGREAVAAAALVTWLYDQETGGSTKRSKINAQNIDAWYQLNKDNIKLDGSTEVLSKWLAPNQSGNNESYGHFLDALEGSEYTRFKSDLENTLQTGVIKEQTTSQDGGTGKQKDPYGDMFNSYYNDIMAYDQEGTMGNKMLENQVSLKTGEANNAAMLAEANLQSQALGQAQSVRDVVNSLKSERMSQLRAGMNQAQLADRELQMLVGSAGQLAQQNQMARQDAVAADLGQNTAYETAFNDYITQAQALGQNAAANYAALVGDSVSQAKLLEDAKKKNAGFITSFNQATGNIPAK